MAKKLNGAVNAFHQTAGTTRAQTSVAPVINAATTSAACHDGTLTAISSMPNESSDFSRRDFLRHRLRLALVSMCDIARRRFLFLRLTFLRGAVNPAQHVADHAGADRGLHGEQQALDLGARRLPDRLDPRLEPRPARGDGVRALVVRPAELPVHEHERKDHEREHGCDQQVIRPARDHDGRLWINPSSFSTSVFCESAFITMTVSRPSATASGICVIANTPMNFRNAPR